MPPAVVFMDGRLKHPFRTYSNEEGNLCVVVCEIPLRSHGIYPITSALLDWVEQKKVRELVVANYQDERASDNRFCSYSSALRYPWFSGRVFLIQLD
jgi:uncharacterized protein